jgi:hypothetical protein
VHSPMRLAPLTCGVLVCLIQACDAASSSAPVEAFPNPPVQQPPPPPPPPVLGPAVRIKLGRGTDLDFAGAQVTYVVEAWDNAGQRTSSNGVRVTSSNTAVADLYSMQVTTVTSRDGSQYQETAARFQMRGPGVATLTARLDSLVDSVQLGVAPLPNRPAALVVDTFTVIEYRDTYLVYAPLLRLREPTGISSAAVVAVEFTLPGWTSGWCTAGSLWFTPGLSAHVNGIDSYLWANDLIYVLPYGGQVADGLARARAIVRDAQGELGLIEATAPIQRNVSNPKLPVPWYRGIGWSC